MLSMFFPNDFSHVFYQKPCIKSWKIRMPTVSRPLGRSVSPFSDNNFTTIIVDEMPQTSAQYLTWPTLLRKKKWTMLLNSFFCKNSRHPIIASLSIIVTCPDIAQHRLHFGVIHSSKNHWKAWMFSKGTWLHKIPHQIASPYSPLQRKPDSELQSKRGIETVPSTAPHDPYAEFLSHPAPASSITKHFRYLKFKIEVFTYISCM